MKYDESYRVDYHDAVWLETEDDDGDTLEEESVKSAFVKTILDNTPESIQELIDEDNLEAIFTERYQDDEWDRYEAQDQIRAFMLEIVLPEVKMKSKQFFKCFELEIEML